MIKRLFDICASIAGLCILSPLLVLLYFRIRADMGSPVLFVQQRPGKDARPFNMVKFRSMRDAPGPDGTPLPDAERITPLGARLRSSSADELPELWNVLKGEMSIVGPRPLLMEYVPLYSPDQARRMDVRPGITGWAQINGRNAISWEEKFALDLWYVDNQSFLLDIRIIWMTLKKVMNKDDISAQDNATMPKFRGSK